MIREQQTGKPVEAVAATGLLADLDMPAPETLKEKTRFYRLVLKPALPYVAGVAVAGWSFQKETYYWEGEGDDARQVYRRGSVVRLTDDEVKAIKRALWDSEAKTGMYVRIAKHPDGTALGVEIIDTNVGTAKGRLFQGGEVGKGPLLDASRLMGGEVPLKDYLDIEPLERDQRDGRSVTAKDLREAAEREEAADHAPPEEPAAVKKARKDLSTTTVNRTGSAGRVE